MKPRHLNDFPGERSYPLGGGKVSKKRLEYVGANSRRRSGVPRSPPEKEQRRCSRAANNGPKAHKSPGSPKGGTDYRATAR